MDSWTKYFKFIKLKRGRVVTRRFGLIDFSRDDLPIETLKALYEEDFPYLAITPEGEKILYGIDCLPAKDPDPEPVKEYPDLEPEEVPEEVPVKKPPRKTPAKPRNK